MVAVTVAGVCVAITFSGLSIVSDARASSRDGSAVGGDLSGLLVGVLSGEEGDLLGDSSILLFFTDANIYISNNKQLLMGSSLMGKMAISATWRW